MKPLTWQSVSSKALQLHIICEWHSPKTCITNILCNNQSTPPLKINHILYVYVSGDEQLADQYGAQFRQESVYTDGNWSQVTF